MEVINKILTLANQHSARFLSLRFIDISGKLQQLDVIVGNLNNTKDFVTVGNKKLKFIEGKYFVDPFRSHPTIFCLCEDLSSKSLPRTDAQYLITNLNIINNISCECKIDFLVENQDTKHLEFDIDITHEPLDKLINLRSEIIDIIENIGIKTIYHCNGAKSSQCIISIKADNLLDMADNIIIIKYIIRNVAESYGKYVTFTRDDAIPLSIYLNLSDYNKDIALSFVSSINKNLNKISAKDFVKGTYATAKFKDCPIIKLSIKTAEINPYSLIHNLSDIK